jgi:Phage integrase family
MANPDGDRHTTSSAARLAIYEYIERINLHQRDGSRAHITPHQFRHTFGTRELNNGGSQEVVQELLDHDDSKITRGYARLTERKLREEFIAAARFNVHGERLELLAPDSPLADIAWMKERLNRARVTLPMDTAACLFNRPAKCRTRALTAPTTLSLRPSFYRSTKHNAPEQSSSYRQPKPTGRPVSPRRIESFW